MEFNDKVERFDNLIIGFSGGRDSSYGVLLIDQMFDKNVLQHLMIGVWLLIWQKKPSKSLWKLNRTYMVIC